MTGFAVIDTNVMVGGVLSGSASSPTGRIVELMLGGNLRFVLSDVLLAEYRRVLLRPRIAKRHGLIEGEVDRLLLAIVANATMRDPAVTLDEGSAPRGDEHLIVLLRAVPGSILVTGDKRLAEAVGEWCDAVTPAAFVANAP